VQGLRADDDRVELEALVVRVPAALVDPAEQPEQRHRVDALAVGDAVLAIGRESEVAIGERLARANLRGFLAEQAGPQAELALALQRGRFGVDPPDQHEVAVEAAVFVLGQIDRVVGVLDPFALRGQELDELRTLRRLDRLNSHVCHSLSSHPRTRDRRSDGQEEVAPGRRRTHGRRK